MAWFCFEGLYYGEFLQYLMLTLWMICTILSKVSVCLSFWRGLKFSETSFLCWKVVLCLFCEIKYKYAQCVVIDSQFYSFLFFCEIVRYYEFFHSPNFYSVTIYSQLLVSPNFLAVSLLNPHLFRTGELIVKL